jgi:hypothetical protein
MSYRHWWVATITLLLAGDAGLAVQKNSRREPAIRHSTYTSADGAFRFSYPANPQVFKKGKIEPSTDCDHDAIVCVVYSKRTTDGRSYGATTTFQVRQVQAEPGVGSMTGDICVTPYPVEPTKPEFMIDAKEPTKTIGGMLFVHGIQDVAAGPQSSYVDLYRTFHNGTCFELSIGDFGTDIYDDTADDSDNQKPAPTALQKAELNPFPQILRSFRFLK